MSKYTIELRKVCDLYGRNEVESWFKDYNLSDYLLPQFVEVVENAGVWDKNKLATKIVNHYYMREIGFETPALFEFKAKSKMAEIMERYSMIIYTNCIEYDPFESVDFHITESRTINNTTNNRVDNSVTSSGTNSSTSSTTTDSDSTSSSSGLQVNSNTPQGQINKASILAGTYASNTSAMENEGTISDDTTTSSSASGQNSNTESGQTITAGTGQTIEAFTHDERGNKGVMDSYQKLIIQLRETIYAVDEKIIEELNDLFINLW